MSFGIAFTNVLITIMYIIPAYLLCKAKKAVADHLSTLSAVLIYICGPCMVVSTFFTLDFSPEYLWKMGLFFIITLVLQAVFMMALYLIFRKKYHISKYRLLTITTTMGNVGFFGLPIVRALCPDNPEVACYSCVYVLSMNILIFTVGSFCLTEKKEYMTLKAGIINPTVPAFALGLVLYLLRVTPMIPTVLADSVSLLGRMTTPLCMIILGIRLGTISLPKLFARPFVYISSAIKLLAFPIFCYAVVYFLPLDVAFKSAILILSGTPTASVVLNLAEMYKSETELSAYCMTLSTLVCFLTIPLLTLLVP